MSTQNPEIQIWSAECDTKEERDKIVRRSVAIDGCRILFVGTNDEGKYVVINSSIGKATTTPAVELYGHKTYPDGPLVEMLAGFILTSNIGIKQARM